MQNDHNNDGLRYIIIRALFDIYITCEHNNKRERGAPGVATNTNDNNNNNNTKDAGGVIPHTVMNRWALAVP